MNYNYYYMSYPFFLLISQKYPKEYMNTIHMYDNHLKCHEVIKNKWVIKKEMYFLV